MNENRTFTRDNHNTYGEVNTLTKKNIFNTAERDTYTGPKGAYFRP